MPTIELSPNGRASCQGCWRKIKRGEVRVGVKTTGSRGWTGSREGLQKKFYHGKCYKGRNDFTKFYGWYKLPADAKRPFQSGVAAMTNEELMQHYEREKARLYPSSSSSSTSTGNNGANDNDIIRRESNNNSASYNGSAITAVITPAVAPVHGPKRSHDGTIASNLAAPHAEAKAPPESLLDEMERMLTGSSAATTKPDAAAVLPLAQPATLPDPLILKPTRPLSSYKLMSNPYAKKAKPISSSPSGGEHGRCVASLTPRSICAGQQQPPNVGTLQSKSSVILNDTGTDRKSSPTLEVATPAVIDASSAPFSMDVFGSATYPVVGNMEGSCVQASIGENKWQPNQAPAAYGQLNLWNAVQTNNVAGVGLLVARSTPLRDATSFVTNQRLVVGTDVIGQQWAAGKTSETSNNLETATTHAVEKSPLNVAPAKEKKGEVQDKRLVATHPNVTTSGGLALQKCLTVTALKARLRSAGLPVGGKKDALIKRCESAGLA